MSLPKPGSRTFVRTMIYRDTRPLEVSVSVGINGNWQRILKLETHLPGSCCVGRSDGTQMMVQKGEERQETWAW